MLHVILLSHSVPSLTVPSSLFLVIGPASFLAVHMASLGFGLIHVSSSVSQLRDAAGRTEAAPVDLSPLGLSPRETEVAALALEGLSNARIGDELFISERTVKNHLVNIYRKAGVDSRLAFHARARGLGAEGMG